MAKEQLEEGQIVLCTVDKIAGTTVFVRIEDYELEGTITTSEIAPGRIRNLRDYVIPGKKIVCQVLEIRDEIIHLSLRRVKPDKRKELLDQIEKERSYKAILKTVVNPENPENSENSEKILEKINSDLSLIELFERIKEEPEILKKYFSNEEAEKIIKILDSKKEKLKESKQTFKISSKSSTGIKTIKEIIHEACKGTKCEIRYVAAGKYTMIQKGEDFKGIKTEMTQAIQKIEKDAKKNNCEFSLEKN